MNSTAYTAPPTALLPRAGRWASRASRGMTLVEVLVATAVLGTAAAAAVPYLGGMIDSARLTSASQTFLAALHMARTQAIKRSNPVVLCKSSNGFTCAETGGWEQGWIVFDDLDGDGQRSEGESIAWREQRLSSSLKLSGNLPVANYVSYSPAGTSRLASGALQAGTLTICTPSPGRVEAREVVLNFVGRPRVQRKWVEFCG